MPDLSSAIRCKVSNFYKVIIAQFRRKKNPEPICDISIQILPADLLVNIIEHLSTDDRIHFGLTCKRIRSIDLSLGKRNFNSLKFTFNCHYLRIEAETSKLSHLENVHYTHRDNRLEHMTLFRKARTKLLKIYYDETSASTYSEIFKKVSFQNLEVIFQSTSEFAAFFPTLIQGRNLDHSNIHLHWWSYGGKELYLIPECRKMLLQLPTMNTLTMHWFPDGNLLDDVTLIHLANNTNEASLCSGDCTPYGILKAFETVCKSEHAFKYLSFYAPQSTVDDLSSLSHPNFESINRHSFSLLLIDRQTNSMLFSIREGDHNWVVMSKLDEDGLPAWR